MDRKKWLCVGSLASRAKPCCRWQRREYGSDFFAFICQPEGPREKASGETQRMEIPATPLPSTFSSRLREQPLWGCQRVANCRAAAPPWKPPAIGNQREWAWPGPRARCARSHARHDHPHDRCLGAGESHPRQKGHRERDRGNRVSGAPTPKLKARRRAHRNAEHTTSSPTAAAAAGPFADPWPGAEKRRACFIFEANKGTGDGAREGRGGGSWAAQLTRQPPGLIRAVSSRSSCPSNPSDRP